MRFSSKPPVYGAALLLIAIGVYASTINYPVERQLFVCRATGVAATTWLIASSLCSLLLRSTALRRGFGIGSAGLAIAHAGYLWTTPMWSKWWQIVYEPQHRAGASTLLILVLLGMTSFSAINRRLRVKLWRELHWLAYAAILLAAHHVALSSRARIDIIAGLCAVVGLLLSARLIRGASRYVSRRGQPDRMRKTPDESP